MEALLVTCANLVHFCILIFKKISYGNMELRNLFLTHLLISMFSKGSLKTLRRLYYPKRVFQKVGGHWYILSKVGSLPNEASKTLLIITLIKLNLTCACSKSRKFCFSKINCPILCSIFLCNVP